MYKTASCLVNDFYTNVIKLQDHCNGFKKNALLYQFVSSILKTLPNHLEKERR